jgi:hypothetical protein
VVRKRLVQSARALGDDFARLGDILENGTMAPAETLILREAFAQVENIVANLSLPQGSHVEARPLGPASAIATPSPALSTAQPAREATPQPTPQRPESIPQHVEPTAPARAVQHVEPARAPPIATPTLSAAPPAPESPIVERQAPRPPSPIPAVSAPVTSASLFPRHVETGWGASA